MDNLSIGIIGIGHIGSAISKRLIDRQYEVYVYDIDDEKKKELESYGAIPVESIRELVGIVNIVLTSLPNDNILKQVVLGKNNIYEHAESGTILIDISTVLPETIKEINRYLIQKDIDVIDCPISGGPKEARNGTLHLIVSCKESIYKNNESLLNAISTQVHFLNENVGEAKVVKLINNTMTLGNVLVAASAFSLGTNYGLNQQNLYDILSKTGGTSHHFVKRFPKVIQEDYSSLFSINLGLKDLKLVHEWAIDNAFNTEVTSFLLQNYQEAIQNGLGNEDIVAVTKKFLMDKSTV